ncbi:hypothetical protein LWI28_027156 [Acer negundo]|uniref:Uncharacterized protein n=1 Tax=Acer negundo TaxID=4023 RepID=A0AAD5NLK7_ACENE|nr:hypothetical protein LWI28_027156 [Acer negundo]
MAEPSLKQNLSMINYGKWVCLQMVSLVILSTLAASFSTVKYLPGFSGSLPFKLETGKEITFLETGFQGYVLGNPETDPKFDVNSQVPYAHRMALISDELYKSAKRNCRGEYVQVDHRNVQCAKDLQAISKHFNTNIMDTWGNDVNVHKALHVRKVGMNEATGSVEGSLDKKKGNALTFGASPPAMQSLHR